MAVTITEERLTTMKKVTFAWTSDASGDASGTTTYAYSGKIEGLTTVPSSTAAPTANYDIVVTDEDSVDVLMSAGANRSDTATEHVQSSSLGCVSDDKLSLAVSNAGDSKAGTVYLWIR